MSVRWINHPHCNASANAKAAQLYVARQAGLDIPPTVITNDAREVRHFAGQSNERIVYKAHSQTFSLEPGKFLYTGIVGDSEVKNLDLIEISPGIFQKYVNKAYEVRATVVGSQIFAGKINSQANAETAVDWRRRPHDIEETPIRLPADIEVKILALMRAFGLYFGALDFIVTPEGRHVFLEVNPAGQYLWVEAATKLPITAALAEALSEPCQA